MQDINYVKLIKLVESSTRRTYQAYEEDNGKLVPNVANLGAKIGDIAKLERHGEYYGIAIQFLEDIKPLLTDRFVIKILQMLNKEEYMKPLSILNLKDMDQLHYILHKWLQVSNDAYDNSLDNFKNEYPKFDKWIKTVTHDPIDAKIKLVDIGYNQNTGASVVPSDWVDRVFDNADSLHREMDKLETRIGKPPVTYAIIYSMIIQQDDTLLNDISDEFYQTLIYLQLKNNNLVSEIVKTKSSKDYSYVKYDKLIIGFKLDDILEKKQTESKSKDVGLLVSRLQKAIRRGRYASKALIETIERLNDSPNYNLPEHNFLRVSASKQLVWRLFITILEDVRPYTPINEISLCNLVLLVLITQKVQEYKFTKPVLDLIKLTALLAQYNDTEDDWYNWDVLPESKKTPFQSSFTPDVDLQNAVSLALSHLIMMSGDGEMLRRYYSEKTVFGPFQIPPELSTDRWKKTLHDRKYIFHDKNIYKDVILSSFDMHVKPHIILYYQSCIPISMTTKEIARYIWDISSSYNVRSGNKTPKKDKILLSIQKLFFKESLKDERIVSVSNAYNTSNSSKTIQYDVIKKLSPDNNAKRTCFLILFGQKYRWKGTEVILAGTKKLPIQIKIDNEWTYYDNKDVLNAYPERIIDLTTSDPPTGFKWTNTKVSTKIIKEQPYVDDNPIPWFDGSSLIESITPIIKKNVDKNLYRHVITIFSGLDIDLDTILFFRTNSMDHIQNWLPESKDLESLDMSLVRLTFTKIFNQFNNLIMIGPVTRLGQKMHNSINYRMEGKLWAIFNLFSYMYPNTIKPHGSLNFIIKKESSGYIHLVNTLETILFHDVKISGSIPIITTKLWDHQIESVNRVVSGFRKGYHGFGDASGVGSGKTLTSLKIAIELIKDNNNTFSGILVLLPGNKLIKTWKEELEKHTKGFDVKFQENNADIGSIQRNTIVITTMGRIRDHPIYHNWLLVIIDECLTVQNKNALWTESAWMQSLMAKHLVMMSATFFRTRFDKLYYMLKMLRTGLPEKREYLETILLESIISKIPVTTRKWSSNFHYFELDISSRKLYDDIDKSNMSNEIKFAKLTSFLVSNTNANNSVIKQLNSLIRKLVKDKRRCLIYAKSKEEAQLWSSKLNISIYPEKGTHCIVSYHDGTYGLNDLIIYNTIIMRPPQPDALPQIKGRLDRPGQKAENLYIEYFVLNNTIEMGLILRMNIASQFIQKYIMPLSKFYDISLNYQKYLDK